MVKTYIKKSEYDGRLWLVAEGQHYLRLKKTEWGFSAGWGRRCAYYISKIGDTWEYRIGDGRARVFDERSANFLESV